MPRDILQELKISPPSGSATPTSEPRDIISELRLSKPDPTGMPGDETQKAILEGAAQGVVSAGRGVREFPGIKQVGDVLYRAGGHIPGISALQKMLATRLGKGPGPSELSWTAGARAAHPWAELGGEIGGQALSTMAGTAGMGAGSPLLRLAKMGTEGALYNPDHPLHGAAQGALLGAFAEKAQQALAGGIRGPLQRIASAAAERGSKLRTPAEVEQLSGFLKEKHPGLKPSLGELTASPGLTSVYQDLLGKVPFTGVRREGEKILNATRAHAQDTLDSLSHGVKPTDVDKEISNFTKGNLAVRKTASNKEYTDISNRAKQIGVTMDAKATADAVKKLTSQRSFPEDYLEGRDKKELDRVLKDPKNMTVEDLRNISSKFKKGARTAEEADDEVKKGVYNVLTDGIIKDYTSAIEKSGDKTLMSSLKTANKNYRANVVPYTNTSSMRKLINPKGVPDAAHKALLKGENIEVLKHMTPEQKDKVLYSHMLARNDKGKIVGAGYADSGDMTRKYESLDDKIRKESIGGRPVKQDLENLRNLHQLSKEPAIIEHAPATGWRQLAHQMPKAIALGGALAAGESAATHPIMGALGGILAGSKATAKALRSDWLRKAYATGELPHALTNKKIPQSLARMLMSYRSATQRGEE